MIWYILIYIVMIFITAWILSKIFPDWNNDFWTCIAFGIYWPIWLFIAILGLPGWFVICLLDEFKSMGDE